MATLNRRSAPLLDPTTRADAASAVAASRGARRAGRSRASAPQSWVAYSLGMATVCALVLVDGVTGDPATADSPALTESASVADALGIEGAGVGEVATDDPVVLEQLAASRSQREADQAAAAASQAQAEQAAAAARAEAEARAVAEAAAAQAAAVQAAAAAEAPAAAGGATSAPAASAAASVAVPAVARISNSAGPVRAQAQAAADAVVSNVPGAGSITIGGTRPGAADPGGHPSGLAVDYMVMSDAALGDAIVEYHIAHWDELEVDYLIWQQRMLTSPGGSWQGMADRGSATANHMDHPHVNYLG